MPSPICPASHGLPLDRGIDAVVVIEGVELIVIVAVTALVPVMLTDVGTLHVGRCCAPGG